MGAATLFVPNLSTFCGLRKIILGVIKKTLPVMEIKKPRILPGSKKSTSSPAFT